MLILLGSIKNVGGSIVECNGPEPSNVIGDIEDCFQQLSFALGDQT